MKSVQVKDIYEGSFTIDLDEPRTVIRLKEKLFKQNRNVFETLLFQEENVLNDNRIIGIGTILIFDEEMFQSKSFPSVSDGFSFRTCPF
jgi:hypothetical protein